MGGTGGRAWQQTRPPAQQQVAPGQLLGFPGRQSNPVTDQALMAEVVAPVVGGDAPDLGRLSQTDAIPIRRHARRTQCPVPGFGGWATTDHGVARPRGILVPVDDTASRRRRRPPRLARPTRTGSGPSALGQAGDRLARWAGPRKRRERHGLCEAVGVYPAGGEPAGDQVAQRRGRDAHRGRSPHAVPVIPVQIGECRYLVSPYGEADWVRNLRAAGEGELPGPRDHGTVRWPGGSGGRASGHDRRVPRRGGPDGRAVFR